MSEAKRFPDVIVRGGGTVYVLFPQSHEAKVWFREHLPEDAMRFAGGTCVEHRYVQDILDGLIGDGLILANEITETVG